VRPEVGKLLEKASRAIDAAQTLTEHGDLDFAAGRAYYAMFYAAEALLIQQNLSFRKHAGVHAAFGEHFAKTGSLAPKYHRWILDAFDKRLQGDYGFDATLAADDVIQMIDRAREFLHEVRRLLGAGE